MTNNQTTTSPAAAGLASFAGRRFVNLETYRRDGTAVRTPLLFVQRDGRLHMRTPAAAYKAKRIRRNPRVRIAPSDVRGKPLGDWIEATARLEPAGNVPWYNRAARRKYGLIKMAMDLRTWFTRRDYVVIVVTPA